MSLLNLQAGDNIEHEVHGEVQLTGFSSVGDEVEIDEVERDGERELDVVMSVVGDKVEFLDTNGREHVEPLDSFFDSIKL